jgi:DNA polymerase I-like protein with 3'-5' exonuclease and polymerase domains
MKTLAVLHIADLFREPKMVLPSQMDWAKVPRILAGEIPKPIPGRPICGPGNVEPALKWMQEQVHDQPDYLVVDTEYTISDRTLLTVGLGARRGDTFSGVQILQCPRLKSWERAALPAHFINLVHHVPAVFQNLMADLPVLRDNWGVSFDKYKQVDDLMLAHALLWTEFPHDLEFLASLYSSYPKLKHLSERAPAEYNWGDVLATDEAWSVVNAELFADPGVRHIYKSRSLPMAFVFIRAHEAGIRVDQSYAKQALDELKGACHNANLLAHASVGQPINVGSTQQVQRALRERDGIAVKSLKAEQLSGLLRKHPENDILQARSHFSQAEGFRKYVAELATQQRVYPEFLPTQSTGRVSVKNPPIANFPDDNKAAMRGLPPLRRCFIPDPGWYWICWDWSSLHARFMAAACRDEEDILAFTKGYDIHLITACRIAGKPLPPDLYHVDSPANECWRREQGWARGDRRRHLAKTVRYALLNGLDERAVKESKEVSEQGLDMDEVVRYARQFLASKPRMVQWKREFAAKAIEARCARSLYGRKRTLINFGERSREENAKAAISGFLQMTEVDIMTETVVEALRKYPMAHLVYPSHDGIKLAFPVSVDSEATITDLKPWVERSHDFWGVIMPLPAEWEVITS